MELGSCGEDGRGGDAPEEDLDLITLWAREEKSGVCHQEWGKVSEN